MNRHSLLEIIDSQNEIIKMENSVINELFHILLQYVNIKDLDNIIDDISVIHEKSKDLSI